jgi:hypothetical protein
MQTITDLLDSRELKVYKVMTFDISRGIFRKYSDALTEASKYGGRLSFFELDYLYRPSKNKTVRIVEINTNQ